MNTTFRFTVAILTMMCLSAVSCKKNESNFSPNGLLKKVIVDGNTREEFIYNSDKMIEVVNSTMLYRKYIYDQENRLVKEELAMNPNAISSSVHLASTQEFVDPNKTGITMFLLFKYDPSGNLSRQLAYVPLDGRFEFRSMRKYEYDNNKISKVLMHDSDSTLTQYVTYKYDSRGNVTEENGYSYLFLPSGAEPAHLYKATFGYDNYLNPFSIFSNTGSPGIYSNINNIIKMVSVSYQDVPGLDNQSQTDYLYEYDPELHYPVKSSDGSEFVYDK
jgi:hypothetical protein